MGLEQLISEEQIRARSYAIWVAEGCQDGRSDEYWFRAVNELEAELLRSWLAALEAHDNADRRFANVVMPKPPISQPVVRQTAGRIDPDRFSEAA